MVLIPSGKSIGDDIELRNVHRDLNPDHFGTTYEFTDCDIQSGFAVNGCQGCGLDEDGSLCVNVVRTLRQSAFLKKIKE